MPTITAFCSVPFMCGWQYGFVSCTSIETNFYANRQRISTAIEDAYYYRKEVLACPDRLADDCGPMPPSNRAPFAAIQAPHGVFQ
jgi:hypothetical protein